jgi:hypothetical protein
MKKKRSGKQENDTTRELILDRTGIIVVKKRWQPTLCTGL